MCLALRAAPLQQATEPESHHESRRVLPAPPCLAVLVPPPLVGLLSTWPLRPHTRECGPDTPAGWELTRPHLLHSRPAARRDALVTCHGTGFPGRCESPDPTVTHQYPLWGHGFFSRAVSTMLTVRPVTRGRWLGLLSFQWWKLMLLQLHAAIFFTLLLQFCPLWCFCLFLFPPPRPRYVHSPQSTRYPKISNGGSTV